MRKVIVHVGAGKCGSSALQEWLSNNPELVTQEGEKILYGALAANGEIRVKNDVTLIAEKSPFQYAASVLLSSLQEDFVSQRKLESRIASLQADILILSCEGWVNEAEKAKKAFACLKGYEIEVLVYIRSPVYWLNSAWWQWGAWSKVEFSNWLNIAIESTYWVDFIESWRRVDCVDRVHVRLFPADIVLDFLEAYNIRSASTSSGKSNTSLPSSVLRFYQNYPELRPAPHDPRIDFSLSRRLSISGSRPDWIINRGQVVKILNTTEPYNTRLLDDMREDQVQLLLEAPEWWSIEAYKELITLEPSKQDISHQDKDVLILESFKALHEADLEILALRRELNSLDIIG